MPLGSVERDLILPRRAPDRFRYDGEQKMVDEKTIGDYVVA